MLIRHPSPKPGPCLGKGTEFTCEAQREPTFWYSHSGVAFSCAALAVLDAQSHCWHPKLCSSSGGVLHNVPGVYHQFPSQEDLQHNVLMSHFAVFICGLRHTTCSGSSMFLLLFVFNPLRGVHLFACLKGCRSVGYSL